MTRIPFKGPLPSVMASLLDHRSRHGSANAMMWSPIFVPQSAVTAGGDHDELFAARRAVRHGRRRRARRQLTAPEHCPGLDVEGAQHRVTRRADENQSARGREGAAEIE